MIFQCVTTTTTAGVCTAHGHHGTAMLGSSVGGMCSSEDGSADNITDNSRSCLIKPTSHRNATRDSCQGLLRSNRENSPKKAAPDTENQENISETLPTVGFSSDSDQSQRGKNKTGESAQHGQHQRCVDRRRSNDFHEDKLNFMDMSDSLSSTNYIRMTEQNNVDLGQASESACSQYSEDSFQASGTHKDKGDCFMKVAASPQLSGKIHIQLEQIVHHVTHDHGEDLEGETHVDDYANLTIAESEACGTTEMSVPSRHDTVIVVSPSTPCVLEDNLELECAGDIKTSSVDQPKDESHADAGGYIPSC